MGLGFRGFMRVMNGKQSCHTEDIEVIQGL